MSVPTVLQADGQVCRLSALTAARDFYRGNMRHLLSGGSTKGVLSDSPQRDCRVLLLCLLYLRLKTGTGPSPSIQNWPSGVVTARIPIREIGGTPRSKL